MNIIIIFKSDHYQNMHITYEDYSKSSVMNGFPYARTMHA